LLAELAQAITLLEITMIRSAAIEAIRAHDASPSETLLSLADDFQYETILMLIQKQGVDDSLAKVTRVG
jgi:hypothetical protein